MQYINSRILQCHFVWLLSPFSLSSVRFDFISFKYSACISAPLLCFLPFSLKHFFLKQLLFGTCFIYKQQAFFGFVHGGHLGLFGTYSVPCLPPRCSVLMCKWCLKIPRFEMCQWALQWEPWNSSEVVHMHVHGIVHTIVHMQSCLTDLYRSNIF